MDQIAILKQFVFNLSQFMFHKLIVASNAQFKLQYLCWENVHHAPQTDLTILQK